MAFWKWPAGLLLRGRLISASARAWKSAPAIRYGTTQGQRNIENLGQDRAAVGEEIRKSVAELFDAALESRAAIAIKGAPEQHAEGADVPGDEDG
jgi:hypothetical protein